MTIELFKGGVSYGGASYNLGDIKPQKLAKLTTGLVLSRDAKGGVYTAKVSVMGNVGPDNSQISALSESTFLILGNNNVADLVGSVLASDDSPSDPEIMGAGTITSSGFDAENTIGTYLYLLAFYMIARTYQKRDLIIPAARKFKSFALHLFSL